MNDLTNISNEMTMGSREIAELCEKRHPDVKRDIEKMLSDIGMGDVSRFAHIYLDGRNRQQTEYLLPKDLTLTLVTGYRADLRYKVVKKLEQLEEERKALALPETIQSLVERTDGISRMLAKKVTNIETMVKKTAEDAAKEYLVNHQVLFRSGKTAGQIWAEYNLPKLKNASTWLGNRLSENGAEMDGRAEAGGRTSRLYDPDKARACMKNGLLHKCKRYVDSRKGQGHLQLVRD